MIRPAFERLVGLGRRPVAALVDLLFPTVCSLCQARLALDEAVVCDPCRAALVADYQWRCARCGALGRGERPSALVDSCERCPPPGSPFRGALWVTQYHDMSAMLVRGFKYHRRREMGELMADLMAARLSEAIGALGELPDPPLWIVPTPLHWRRGWTRGFNQSDLLAERLARATGLELAPVLRRVRHTRRQARIPRDRRAANVAGAFAIAGGVGRPIPSCILVDDVMTSGHTASECAKALRAAGAPEVWIACFARA